MDVNNVRQRLEQVVAQSGFRLVTDKSDKLSHYYELKHKGTLVMSVIRVSNHCTDVSTWKERYGSINPSKQLSNKEKRRCRGNYAGLNDKYFQKKFYSIVIFDPTTDGVQNSGDVNDGSIFVKQRVYDATKMTNENLVECENFIKTIASSNITENINRNRNMNKNRIRLTESQLHRVIKESVKRILKEDFNDPFNFFPDEDEEKEPTHRINLFYQNGTDVSSPAIFASDDEAVQAAIKKAQSDGGVCGIKVSKYSGVYDEQGFTSLKTIYDKGKTY